MTKVATVMLLLGLVFWAGAVQQLNGSKALSTNSATDPVVNITLQDCSDVDDTSPSSGKIIKWDGDSWAISDESGGSGVFEESSSVVRQAAADYNEDFVFGSPQLDDDGNSAHDARFIFDKSSGAFRAGAAQSTQWNTSNLGNYSIAMGFNTIASGATSIALGSSATASGLTSIACGSNSTASGGYAFTFGNSVTARSAGSIALGTAITVGTTDNDALYAIGVGLDETPRTLTQANTMAIMGGKVGIADLTPEYELDVTGDINFTGNLREDGNIVSIPVIKSGTINVVLDGGASSPSTEEVTFNTPFSSADYVVNLTSEFVYCSGEAIWCEADRLGVSDLDTDGFILYYGMANAPMAETIEVQVYWTAIEIVDP